MEDDGVGGSTPPRGRRTQSSRAKRARSAPARGHIVDVEDDDDDDDNDPELTPLGRRERKASKLGALVEKERQEREQKKRLRQAMRDRLTDSGELMTPSKRTQIHKEVEERLSSGTPEIARTSASRIQNVDAQKNRRQARRATKYATDDDLMRAAAHFPTAPTKEQSERCLINFLDSMTLRSQGTVHCTTCGCRMDREDAESFRVDEFLERFGSFLRIWDGAPKFECLHSLWNRYGILDQLVVNRHGFTIDEWFNLVSATVCGPCCRAVPEGVTMDRFPLPGRFLSNGNYFGEIPDELSSLTQAETIALGLGRARIFHVKLHPISNMKTAQRFYKGHAIAFFQDPTALFAWLVDNAPIELPLPPTAIVSQLRVAFAGEHQDGQKVARHVLQVRPNVLLKGIQWLKNCNPDLRSIVLRQDYLDMYPTDGSLAPGLEHCFVEAEDAAEHEGYFERFDSNGSTFVTAPNDAPEPQFVGIEHSSVAYTDESIVHLSDLAHAAATRLQNASLRFFSSNAPEVQPEQAPASEWAATPQQQEYQADVVFRSGAPISTFDPSALLVMCFPSLFPYGMCHVGAPRRSEISYDWWIERCLLDSSQRFETHDSFIFLAHNMKRRHAVMRRARLLVKLSLFESISKQVHDPLVLQRAVSLAYAMKADQLDEIARLEAEGADRNLANRLVHQLQLISSEAPGTFFARKRNAAEMRALGIFSGLPLLFVTINFADTHSPLVQLRAGKLSDFEARIAADLPTPQERAENVASFPVATAQAFHRMFDAILLHLFGWDMKAQRATKSGGILGFVDWFYFIMETQNRGSLHMHGLIRLVGTPEVLELAAKLQNDEWRERFCVFLNRIIECRVPFGEGSQWEKFSPPPELRAQLDDFDQTFHDKGAHQHPSAKRAFAPGTEEFERFGELDLWDILHHGQLHEHTFTCFKKGCYCRFCFPRIRWALTHFTEDNVLHLARNHPWVNPFNRYLAWALRANHDLRLIGTGKAAYSSIKYCELYATKQPCEALKMWKQIDEFLSKPRVQDALGEIDDDVERARSLCVRLLHALSGKVLVSGVLACSDLLQKQDFRTTHLFCNIFFTQFLSYAKRNPLTTAIAESGMARSINEDNDPQVRNDDDHDDDNDGARDDASDAANDDNDDDEHDEDIQLFDEDEAQGNNISVTQNETAVLTNNDAEDNVYIELRIANDGTVTPSAKASCNQVDTYVHRPSCLEDHSVYKFFSLYWKGRGQKGRSSSRLAFLGSHPQASSHCLIAYDRVHVPVVKGDAFRTPPMDETPANQKEIFALRLLLLFRPWRRVEDLLTGVDSRSFYTAYISWEHGAPAETRFWIRNALAYFQSLNENPDFAARLESELDPDVNDPDARNAKRPVDVNVPDEGHDAQDDDNDDSTQPVLTLKVQRALAGAYKIGLLPQVLVRRSHNGLSSYAISAHPALSAWLTHKYAAADPQQGMPSTSLASSTGPVLLLQASRLIRPDVELLRQSSHADIEAIVARFSLNDKQAEGFRFIAQRLTTVMSRQHLPDPLRMFLTGPAGTGKSQILKAIQHFMKSRGCGTGLRVLSFCGSAATLVDGETVSRAFGFGIDPYQSLSHDSLAVLQDAWKDIFVLVIDEISTLGCELLYLIDQRAKLIKGNNDFMGGMHFIVCGDLHQAAPIGATALWKTPSSVTRFEAHAGRALWIAEINTSIFLTEIMRQRDEKEWAELLCRLRSGQCTIEDVRFLEARARATSIDLDDPAWQTATCLSPQNDVCNAYSARCANRDAALAGRSVIVWHSNYKRSGVIVAANKTLHKATARMCGPHSFYYAPNMPVMLLCNQICGPESVQMGLANGVVGRAIGLLFEADEPPVREDVAQHTLRHVPRGMFVYVPTATVTPLPYLDASLLALANNDPTKIILVRPQYYKLDKNAAWRYQFPLSPAYALTFHKSQGLSLDNIVVDSITQPKENDHHNLVYVALSRVRLSQGLAFLGPLPPGWLDHKPHSQLLKEEERLAALDITTRQ